MSGSGKSTLAKDLAKEFNCSRVELDDIESHFMTLNKEKHIQEKIYKEIKNECPEVVDFLLDIDRNKRYVFDTWCDGVYVISEFIDWFSEKVKNDNKLYIINGAQIFTILSPEYFKDKPLIVKEINILKSLTRRTMRALKKKHNKSFKKNFKKALKIWFGKNYRDTNRKLKEYVKAINIG